LSGRGSDRGDDVEIVVVGSINLDLSLDLDRFPQPGETVLGRGLLRGGGGKGANQAVAAARLGRRVGLVGLVGHDGDGGALRALLEAEGIDLSAVGVHPTAPTGLAVIEVDSSGENRIVVIPGANGEVRPDDLGPVGGLLAGATVVLAQLEIPVPTVEALARRPRSGRLILNPAPAAPVDLTGVDLVVPNRTELAILAGADPASDIDEVVDQALAIGGDPEAVIATLGAGGSLVVQGLRGGPVAVDAVPAVPADAVDTTGAGDAYCGGLADALCLGADLVDAARWATRVASVAVTRPGAWDAFPRRSELV